MRKRNQAAKHQWLADRAAESPSLVMRIDNYSCIPENRGQFMPKIHYPPDAPQVKAIWPNRELACHAAEWAAKKFGHTYAVFTMIGIVEQDHPPLKITVI